MAGISPTAPDERVDDKPQGGRPGPATEAFLAHRNLLFTVAYEMLGSAADTEDRSTVSRRSSSGTTARSTPSSPYAIPRSCRTCGAKPPYVAEQVGRRDGGIDERLLP